jgi:cytochrome b561
MSWNNTTDRYGALSIAMHWLMLLLLVGVYACINLRELYPRGSDPRENLETWHFMLGLTVFALVFLRVAIRWLGVSPRIQPQPPLWQRRLAGLMHLALYVFLIAMPLLGWLTLSAEGKPIPFFGLQLPALVGASKALAGPFKEIHETIGTIGYYLIGLHAAAALFHHYVARDNTLLRMLPRRIRPV